MIIKQTISATHAQCVLSVSTALYGSLTWIRNGLAWKKDKPAMLQTAAVQNVAKYSILLKIINQTSDLSARENCVPSVIVLLVNRRFNTTTSSDFSVQIYGFISKRYRTPNGLNSADVPLNNIHPSIHQNLQRVQWNTTGRFNSARWRSCRRNGPLQKYELLIGVYTTYLPGLDL